MKNTFIIIAFLAGFGRVFGQLPTDPRHENHYGYISPIITEELKIEFVGMHSQMNFAIIKLRITNKTNDFIAFRANEMILKIENREHRPSDRVYIIAPRDYITRTIRVSGDNRFHVDSYTLQMGGFYRIPVEGKTQKAGNFKLPNNVNNFELNEFQCKVAGKIIKHTQMTEVPFRCTYTGNKVGMIEASRISVKLEDGKEFANVNTGSKLKNLTSTGSTDLLFPGEDTKIVAIFRIPAQISDMQFANMDVIFNDTFAVSELIPLKTSTVTLVLDQNLTNNSNK